MRQPTVTKRLKVMKRRLGLTMQMYINRIRRRPEYIFYSIFGLFVLVSAMLAFWPKKAEKFNIFVPEQNQEIKDPGAKVSFELTKIYGAGTVKKPVSVFVDEKNLYVTDVAKNNIKIFDRSGKTLAVISGTGKKQADKLDYPNGIAPLDKDKLLVTESGGKRLIIYTRDSAYVKILDIKASKILKPGHAVSRDNKIYIADLEAHDIKVLDKEGKYISAIASPINKVLLLKYPQGMDFDSKGTLWVADGGNERVVNIDAQGRFLKSFKGSEKGGTPFSMVKGLAILKGRYLCVSDPMANKVRVFDILAELKEVGSIGGTGNAKEKFVYPMGLFADKNNHLFVADRGNSRIQEFVIK